MAETRRVVRIVVASPSDVPAERQALSRVVDELNETVAADRQLHLVLARWETDAYPGFHIDGPQGLVDQVLRIEESDVVIGVFWTRFGTPVNDADSGTEHELRQAYQSWQASQKPDVMVYFNTQPYSPQSPAEARQWERVLTFRASFPKEGMWWPYEGPTEFERFARQHLARVLRARFPTGPSATSNAKYPSLTVHEQRVKKLRLTTELQRILDRASELAKGVDIRTYFYRLSGDALTVAVDDVRGFADLSEGLVYDLRQVASDADRLDGIVQQARGPGEVVLDYPHLSLQQRAEQNGFSLCQLCQRCEAKLKELDLWG